MKRNVKVNSFPIYLLCFLLLLIILFVSLLVSVTIGQADISISDVYKVIGYKLFHIDAFQEFDSGAVSDIVWLIRLPRTLLAIAVGAGLSVCGLVMQAVVKNPLADPFILGISSGASLGATLAIMLGIGTFLGGNATGIMAFIGALIIAFAVMFLANLGGHATSIKLLLAGTALSSICSAFSSFVIYISNNKEATKEITFWLMGSLAGANWNKISVIIPLVILAVLFFTTQYRTLNLMLLGDETAITLGTNLHHSRHLFLIISAIIVGFAVYSSGMIGFVGLIIPHVVRMLFGSDHKKLIPLSAVTGAIFLIWADVLCRSLLDKSELPIGVLISMIGAPCFIVLMIKKSYGFGGGK